MTATLLATQRLLLSNGRGLRLARLGAGPAIVLLHGYPDNLQLWHDVAPRLAVRREVVAFDWPGLGASDEWPGGATPQHLAQRIVAVLDELRLERVTLVGFDMGGQAALACAALHPDRVERLVVSNSLVFGDAPTSWEIRWLRKFRFNRLALRWLPGIIFRRAEQTFLPRGAQLDAALRADFWTTFRRPEVRRFLSKMCAGYQGTLDRLPELYPRIAAPTRVVWSERDAHFPPVIAERLAASVPGARLRVVPGGTHWLPITHAAELADEIAS